MEQGGTVSDFNWETRDDRFLSLSARFSVALYGGSAAALLCGMYLLGVGSRWWTPVLMVYAIGALAHILGFGFQSLNVQIKVISDHWEEKMDQGGAKELGER